MTETPDVTTTAMLRGREVVVQMPTDAQFMLLSRVAKDLQRFKSSSPEADKKRLVSSLQRVYDIFEQVLVDPDDREYLIDLIVAREVEVGDLMDLIKAFGKEQETEPEKPKVTRGRPRKRAAAK